MPRFHILFSGTDILLDQGAGEPIVGFIAPRIGKAKKEEDAINLAKINLLKHWKHNFNRDNKSGTPQITLLEVTRIKNPFKRLRFETELFFYRNLDERESTIERCQKALTRWFRIR